MSVPALKMSPIPAAVIALAFAAAPAANAADCKSIHMKSAAAMKSESGAAAGMIRWAAAVAPETASSSAVIGTAMAYDAAVAEAATALKTFQAAASEFAASTSRLSSTAWTNTQSAIRTAQLTEDAASRAGLARAVRGAQAVYDGLMTVADLSGVFAGEVAEVSLDEPTADGIMASVASAASGAAALREAMADRVNWTVITKAMDDLTHDVLAVIGKGEDRAVPRNTAFIQIKAAQDALVGLRSLSAPDLDMMAITHLEILRLAGRGL